MKEKRPSLMDFTSVPTRENAALVRFFYRIVEPGTLVDGEDLDARIGFGHWAEQPPATDGQPATRKPRYGVHQSTGW